MMVAVGINKRTVSQSSVEVRCGGKRGDRTRLVWSGGGLFIVAFGGVQREVNSELGFRESRSRLFESLCGEYGMKSCCCSGLSVKCLNKRGVTTSIPLHPHAQGRSSKLYCPDWFSTISYWNTDSLFLNSC